MASNCSSGGLAVLVAALLALTSALDVQADDPDGKTQLHMHMQSQQPRRLQTLSYTLRESSSCTVPITTLAECSAAAAALGLDDTTAAYDGQTATSYDPPHCYFEGGELKLNMDGTNTGACSTQDQCLCAAASPPPPCLPPGYTDFDTVTSGWSTAGVVQWTLGDGSTPTGATGPSGGRSGASDVYYYLEVTGVQPGDEGRLEYDGSGVPSPTVCNASVSFWYNMHGADIGSLRVERSDSTVVWSSSGDLGDVWRRATVSLGSPAFAFVGVRGPGYAGDMAIDDVYVFCPDATGGTTLHVAPGTPASTDDGSAARPFRSLGTARDAMRYGHGAGTNRTVLLSGADFFLTSPFVLGPSDSGTPTSTITYRTNPSAPHQARVSGGVVVPASAFTAVSVPSGASGVLKASLSALGIGASSLGGLRNPAPSTILELYYDGAPMTLARDPNIAPNGTWMWAGYENVQLDASDPTMSLLLSDAPTGTLWKTVKDHGRELWLHGYWKYDWREAFVKVASIQAESASVHKITRDAATPPYYPWISGCRFYAVGALELLDSPNEYWVNTTSGELFFLPPGGTLTHEVAVSVLTNTILIDGVRAHLSSSQPSRCCTLLCPRSKSAAFVGVCACGRPAMSPSPTSHSQMRAAMWSASPMQIAFTSQTPRCATAAGVACICPASARA